MKLLIPLAAFIALCAGSPLNAVSTVPGDNSHYVEGQSRYIWMPDGDGVPQLVDLEEREPDAQFRNGERNAYWLFTRGNPKVAQVLVNGDINSVRNSFYNPNLPLKVIAHGWRSSGSSEVNTLITEAFLETSNVNVIVLDWSRTASRLYWNSANDVPEVGRALGQFLEWLVSVAGGNWNNTHMVGHSLGAHLVSNAGRYLAGRVARVTGLDPAGPIWGGNANAMQTGDAQYVEAIHTDGGRLGIMDPIGDTNFYPNGGRNSQPGCWVSTCSHSRAYYFFASSVYTDHFLANRCNDLTEARRQRCAGAADLTMGNGNLHKRGHGLYGLATGRNWPY